MNLHVECVCSNLPLSFTISVRYRYESLINYQSFLDCLRLNTTLFLEMDADLKNGVKILKAIGKGGFGSVDLQQRPICFVNIVSP